MSEYYAVIRSTNHLAHYGIKGMKWGVRKAIQSGNSAKLSRQYAKAQKKLEKLNAKADTKLQSENAKKYGKVAKTAGTIGATGLASAGGLQLYRRGLTKNFYKDATARVHELNPGKYYDGTPATNGKYAITSDTIRKTTVNDKKLNDTWTKYFNKQDAAERIRNVAGGIGALGTAVAIGAGAKALAAKRRTSTAGHAAAVARRNEFQREMNKAFAGTKYASGNKNATNSRKKNTGNSVLRDAVKSAGLSLVMGPAAANYVSSRRIANEPQKKKGKK